MFATQLTYAPWDAGDSLKDKQKTPYCYEEGPQITHYFPGGFVQGLAFASRWDGRQVA